MITERKKEYMKKYNKRLEVKAKKATYMVRFLLNSGYENMAFDYAKQYAPEMLVTIRSSATRKLK